MRSVALLHVGKRFCQSAQCGALQWYDSHCAMYTFGKYCRLFAARPNHVHNMLWIHLESAFRFRVNAWLGDCVLVGSCVYFTFQVVFFASAQFLFSFWEIESYVYLWVINLAQDLLLRYQRVSLFVFKESFKIETAGLGTLLPMWVTFFMAH